MSNWLLVFVFLLGVMLGVVADDVYEMMAEEVARRRKEKTVSDTPPKDEKKKVNFLGVTMVVMTVMLSAVTILLVYTLSSVQDYTKCVYSWQDQFSKAYNARIAAAEPVSAATDKIIFGIADDDTAAAEKAIDEYVTVRERQVEERAKNPVPAPPSAVCGEPLK